MAAGGGATTAYICVVQNYRLEVTPTTKLRTQCVKVADAFEALQRGETVTVAGPDMAQLRQRLAAFLDA